MCAGWELLCVRCACMFVCATKQTRRDVFLEYQVVWARFFSLLFFHSAHLTAKTHNVLWTTPSAIYHVQVKWTHAKYYGQFIFHTKMYGNNNKKNETKKKKMVGENTKQKTSEIRESLRAKCVCIVSMGSPVHMTTARTILKSNRTEYTATTLFTPLHVVSHTHIHPQFGPMCINGSSSLQPFNVCSAVPCLSFRQQRRESPSHAYVRFRWSKIYQSK